ncbi:MAG: 3-oxoacyl-ACP reductase family protein, partial [archaeon]|nr:3-oxoacyl-ACP reductase family protein [archaeon]
IVTGSSRGIGRAIAVAFAKEGAKVVINFSKSSGEAQDVLNEIKTLGAEAISVQCDVSNEKQVEKMVEQAINEFGKIDILVNNAGIVFDVPFFERTVEQWKRTLEVDLIGVFLMSKYVAKFMLKQKSGRIVNISSTCGTKDVPPTSVDYNAAKVGVISFTRSLAQELAPYVNVNAVAPGWVDTDINKDLPKKYIQDEMEKILLKRFADPKEIASVVVFLASDDARYVNGTTIIVDGGYP